jgi:hypothetical protein
MKSYTETEVLEIIKKILFCGDPLFYLQRGIDVDKRAKETLETNTEVKTIK